MDEETIRKLQAIAMMIGRLKGEEAQQFIERLDAIEKELDRRMEASRRPLQ